MLLICGGTKDRDIQALAYAARQQSVTHMVLHTEESQPHQLAWDISNDKLVLNGQAIRPKALYMRYNRFEDDEPRSNSDLMTRTMWYHTLKDWAITHDDVRYFNKPYGNNHTDKVRNLVIAAQCGFNIPRTVVTNAPLDRNTDNIDDFVIKHIASEIPTKEASVFYQNHADARWIHLRQQKLIYPELRIFVVGKERLGFEIHSNEVDYRYAKERTIVPTAVPESLIKPLEKLCNSIGLDWAAADFKTDPATGTYMFLEINDQPMFAGFDACANGQIANAILTGLAL